MEIGIEEAVYFLMTAAKFENDGADIKINWVKEGKTVGTGKFKSDGGTVVVKIDGLEQTFKGRDAARLRKLGVLQAAE